MNDKAEQQKKRIGLMVNKILTLNERYDYHFTKEYKSDSNLGVIVFKDVLTINSNILDKVTCCSYYPSPNTSQAFWGKNTISRFYRINKFESGWKEVQ